LGRCVSKIKAIPTTVSLKRHEFARMLNRTFGEWFT
jgi:hypothetical protein